MGFLFGKQSRHKSQQSSSSACEETAAGSVMSQKLMGNSMLQQVLQQGGGAVVNESGEVLMSPDLLDLAQSSVMSDPAYKARDVPNQKGELVPTTYCNLATSDVISAFGNQDLASVKGTYAGLANQLNGYLNGTPSDPSAYGGFTHDWLGVDNLKGSQLAADGVPVLQSSTASDHGHITTAMAPNEAGAPTSAHVGGGTNGPRTLIGAHGQRPVQSFATSEALATYDNGIRSQDGMITIPTPACFDPEQTDLSTPNQSFLDAETAKAFYGERVLDVLDVCH